MRSLPKTLDETYSRILCGIAEEHREYAIRILQWLTYSARPLRIEELAETIAINTECKPWLDCDARFPEPQDILLICPGLATIEDDLGDDSGWESGHRSTSIVRLAHFSVKEYLVSERIQAQSAKEYAIREIPANQSIAAACLAYLLHFDQYDDLTSETMTEFPLARYAAEYWIQHVKIVGKDLGSTRSLSMELFLNHRIAYVNWVRFCDPENPWGKPDLERDSTSIATPLYYASMSGSDELVQSLLDEEVDVNARSGYFGNALQAASRRGDEAVVRLLLDKGADVNASSNAGFTALHVAAANENQSIVRVLVKNNASLDALNLFSETALHLASQSTSSAVVNILIEGGANPLIIDNYGCTSLDWASMYQPCLEAMGDWATNYTATLQSTRNARLNETVINLTGELQHKELSASYYRLGHVLTFLGDLSAASIAFEQDVYVTEGHLTHRAWCNRCNKNSLIEGYRHVCRSCADVDLCQFCFEFLREEISFERCHNHEFIRIPRDIWRDLKPNCVNENGNTIQMWLAKTHERYKC